MEAKTYFSTLNKRDNARSIPTQRVTYNVLWSTSREASKFPKGRN
jgi:hypothetical protein